MTAEGERLADAVNGRTPWHEWGPYVADRAWGTVREDYSATGDAWRSFPHDHARSRAYRWGEDGLAGLCDARQGLCFALALWNGRDPILKERLFGLANEEGNHGEDAKEYWWHLDALPSSAWLSWRYHYPRRAFPYEDLVAENARRGPDAPEYELLDTGAFDDGYWAITVDYAKSNPRCIFVRVRVRNTSDATDTLHLLPTVWFRNTWTAGKERPVLYAPDGEDDRLLCDHGTLGRWELAAGPGPAGATPTIVCCDNDTNSARLYGATDGPAFPKDGINDHVIAGADTVNPARRGTKGAFWYELSVPAGHTVEVRMRLAHLGECDDPVGPRHAVHDPLDGFDDVMQARRAEADEFYSELTPPGASADEALVMRRAYAGLLWTRQFYRYDVDRWLDGDPGQPAPPPGRGAVRNGSWRHLDANDVIVMPDGWEYPWFASWDLAFHAVCLAHVDPGQAKQQLLLLTREWYQHPSGALPAYEWNFDDANPPVHAFAAMRIFRIDGSRDYEWLERIFHKLLINFTWWVNRQDEQGNNIFEGGFLGLDNIGPFNRSRPLPGGAQLEQSDGTAWMAMYCLNMLDIALVLAVNDHTYEDLAVKFFEHFVLIASALNELDLWDEEDGFYYDVVTPPGGSPERVKAHSMVGVIPVMAATAISADAVRELPEFVERVLWFVEHKPTANGVVGRLTQRGEHLTGMLSVVGPERLARVLARVFDEAEFLSPHGLRSLSRWHAEHPFTIELAGERAVVDYEPAESGSRLFGGNSNWRGPIWFPLNYLFIESLIEHWRYLGDDFTVEWPTGSGHQVTLVDAAVELARRLVTIFTVDGDGRRPVFGAQARFQSDPDWRDLVLFHEYFDGDTAAGLGASHQTGWTALVGNLVRGLHAWRT